MIKILKIINPISPGYPWAMELDQPLVDTDGKETWYIIRDHPDVMFTSCHERPSDNYFKGLNVYYFDRHSEESIDNPLDYLHIGSAILPIASGNTEALKTKDITPKFRKLDIDISAMMSIVFVISTGNYNEELLLTLISNMMDQKLEFEEIASLIGDFESVIPTLLEPDQLKEGKILLRDVLTTFKSKFCNQS